MVPVAAIEIGSQAQIEEMIELVNGEKIGVGRTKLDRPLA